MILFPVATNFIVIKAGTLAPLLQWSVSIESVTRISAANWSLAFAGKTLGILGSGGFAASLRIPSR
jgi:hypothetical protein